VKIPHRITDRCNVGGPSPAQTGFRPPSLFRTRVLARRSSYSRRSNGQTEQKEERDGYKGSTRVATWPPVVRLRGTRSARKHKAPLFSRFLFSSFLFMPTIGRNLTTRRCTRNLRWRTSTALLCIFYLRIGHSLIYQSGASLEGGIVLHDASKLW